MAWLQFVNWLPQILVSSVWHCVSLGRVGLTSWKNWTQAHSTRISGHCLSTVDCRLALTETLARFFSNKFARFSGHLTFLALVGYLSFTFCRPPWVAFAKSVWTHWHWTLQKWLVKQLAFHLARW